MTAGSGCEARTRPGPAGRPAGRPGRPVRRGRWTAVTVAAALVGAAGLVACASGSQAAAVNLVRNPTMEAGTGGWFAAAPFTVSRAAGGRSGRYAVRLVNAGGVARTGALNDAVNTVTSTVAGRSYTASAWVRSPDPGRSVSLRIMEYRGRTYLGQSHAAVTLAGTGWQRLTTTYRARTGGAGLDLNVVGSRLPVGGSILVDDVALREGGATTPPPGPGDPGPAGWRLRWADEFDGPDVDRTRWTVEDRSTYGDGNSELACLLDRPENVRTADGVLTIRARREPVPVLCGDRDRRFPGGRSYTSAMLRTTASWTYGRIEMRAQLPTLAGRSKGLWPAFWMRPASGGPGEIDILEAVGTGSGSTGGHRVHHTIWHDYAGARPPQSTAVTTAFDPSAGFHTYAVEWEPAALRWYVDGALTWSRTTATTPWLADTFGVPYVIRLNLAVGGTWPGSPVTATAFPADYQVDWVRVYGR